jgi:DNA-binding transcriptional MerR regulator
VSETPVAPKEYYSIGEVCDLAGLKPHVLRYWEGQFPVLAPSKNRSGNRVYLRKEIELILLIKQLLHEEKYTIEGARRRLNQLRRGGELPAATALAVDRELLLELRADLRVVLDILSVDHLRP